VITGDAPDGVVPDDDAPVGAVPGGDAADGIVPCGVAEEPLTDIVPLVAAVVDSSIAAFVRTEGV
jgi:hypothetical protein